MCSNPQKRASVRGSQSQGAGRPGSGRESRTESHGEVTAKDQELLLDVLAMW